MGLFDLFGKQEEKRQEEAEFNAYLEEHKALDALERRYSSIDGKHFSLLESEGSLYSQLHKSGAWTSKNASRLIKICLDDIAIADKMRDYWLEEKRIRHVGGNLPSYPAFETLAKLYERQERYAEAVQICKSAIALGYTDDGTKGGMRGRIERLEKKMQVKSNAIAQK